jgi:alpha-L-arabinofuranosidase
MHNFDRRNLFLLPFLALLGTGCQWFGLGGPDSPTVTVLDRTRIENPSRLGINVGKSVYYGDQQVSASLLPHGGFAKGQQTLLIRVKDGTKTTVTDSFARPDKPNRSFHDSFEGGTYTIMSGKRAGETGRIVAHAPDTSVFTLEHSGTPMENDDIVILKSPYVSYAQPAKESGEQKLGIGEFITIQDDGVALRFQDAPSDPADQFLRIEFANREKKAAGGLKHYFTATAETEYVATVRARAEGDTEDMKLSLSIVNLGIKHNDRGARIGMVCDDSPTLTREWKTYTFHGTTEDNPYIAMRFSALKVTVSREPETSDTAALIDYIDLQDTRKASPTGFNSGIVAAIKEAQCGVLRFYGLADNGSTVDAFTSASPTYSAWNYVSYQNRYAMQSIQAVLDDWMKLSSESGSQPWISVGGANTPDDWYNLVSYLAAPAGTDAYADKRVRNGHSEPWLDSFDTVYLEIGNEWWNTLFRPYHIWTPENYAELCNTIIRKVESHPNYDRSRIKLVVGGWAANARDWNQRLDATVEGHDFISIAPYILHRLDRYATVQDKYGALFADTEAYSKRAGKKLLKQLKKNGDRTSIAVYELNTHLTEGEAPASVASELCVSQASGVAVLDQAMTLLHDMRAAPITYFTLLKRGDGRGEERRLGLWGNLLRLEDGTFRARPVWQGLRLANQHVIAGDMIEARMKGSSTWNQTENGSIPAMRKVPYLHSYAFRTLDEDSSKRVVNLLLINRHLTDALPVTIDLPFEPESTVKVTMLTSPNLADNNEERDVVQLESDVIHDFHQGMTVQVPAHSAAAYQIHEQ